jgi:hypothetical protein
MSEDMCEICGATDRRIESHHISYQSEERIDVCRQCHEDIHHTDRYDSLQPEHSEQSDYYNSSIEVDKSQVPARPGWTVQIKHIPCSGSDCPSCPHGPYYYYYKREGDDVLCEYGGVVQDSMLMSQTSLAEFTNQREGVHE